jgi:hypothetical protein
MEEDVEEWEVRVGGHWGGVCVGGEVFVLEE